MYTEMLRIRLVEEALASLYPQQEIRSPLHLYVGQEAIAVGVCLTLTPTDYVFGTYRGHGIYLAVGGDLGAMMAELYGREGGCARGRGGSMHLTAPERGLLGCSAIVGGTIPLAVGAALAAKLSNSGAVAAAFFGDGAIDEGVFYESINFAALKRLPVIFVCENNGYATHSAQRARQPLDNIFRRAEVWGFPGVRVDGNDVIAVYGAAYEASLRARRGEGPTLLECRTYRWRGHVGPSGDIDLGYRNEDELIAWQQRCPIEHLKALLVERAILTRSDLNRIEGSIRQHLETSLRFGKLSPVPSVETLADGVYAE
jgi:pyruvate dehydrogenase E1 component alpha subunit